ncbi:MAG: gfo/Idh/MocA family oxidoreductase, partial [Usitatibacter sp.]
GAWDPARPTEGAYAALLNFTDGAFATLTYSGYGHFDSDDLMGGVGELGQMKDATSYGAARRALATTGDSDAEEAAKTARSYGGAGFREAAGEAPWHEHFGFVVVTCERGDIRPMADGVHVFTDRERRFEPLARPAVPRAAVLDELCDAAFENRAGAHDAPWGRATLEVCLALLESARTGADVTLQHQVAVG